MRAWIARHPLIFCCTLFAVLMLSAKYLIVSGVDHFGVWVGFAVGGVCLLIGFIMDHRDRQRDKAR